MKNYRESEVMGTQYTRAVRAVFENPVGGAGKAVTFIEEDVVALADRRICTPAGNVTQALTQENISTSFPVFDANGQQVASATYGEVYRLLASLYAHVAGVRDIAQQPSQLTDAVDANVSE